MIFIKIKLKWKFYVIAYRTANVINKNYTIKVKINNI